MSDLDRIPYEKKEYWCAIREYSGGEFILEFKPSFNDLLDEIEMFETIWPEIIKRAPFVRIIKAEIIFTSDRCPKFLEIETNKIYIINPSI